VLTILIHIILTPAFQKSKCHDVRRTPIYKSIC